MTIVIPFNDEQARTVANLASAYQAWRVDSQRLASMPYHLTWKTISGNDYLYRLTNREGAGTSIGPRNDVTEGVYETYRKDKAELKDRIIGAASTMDVIARQYRALGLPMLPKEAGDILREADIRGLLGDTLLVVGTNAMPAYSLEANGVINAPQETRDFDMTWSANKLTMIGARPVWDMLKAVDSTYTWVEEKRFQARNRNAFEFELLAAPSVIGNMSGADLPRPVPLEEQEWLLMGTPVRQVVITRDLKPACIVAPDPRYFALQKLWMSVQPKRDPLKKPKDRIQGMAILRAVHEAMPHYPLDAEFQQGIPDEIRPQFEAAAAEIGIEAVTAGPKP